MTLVRGKTWGDRIKKIVVIALVVSGIGYVGHDDQESAKLKAEAYHISR